ncbi:SgcJ/EcaC family oxidoreductase [Lentzea tibetensis]|uniref:SgcJ/EcaC family oxidoreductase n=1 Tax=Lentzea tibetensis TaxID=2591470 RepID=A0A563ESX5_9PSEU|nr:SgcJ/EcaC family oxidoreductase [Lentzea tibetensis]TWP50638.1 SgcJ/EcaC family oxidoreductase [Lentzea tibetensis]
MNDIEAIKRVVAQVLFIRPDVAAVKLRQRSVTLDGKPVEGEPEGSPMYVMAKEDGRWRLVAAQNTIVQA